MSNSTDAHDPSVGEDADTSPASLGRSAKSASRPARELMFLSPARGRG